MDAELKAFLEHMMSSIMGEMSKRFDEVNRRFERMEGEMRHINTRLDRQGGMIQAGMRTFTRFNQWSNTIDEEMTDVLSRLGTVEERLNRLERR